MQSRRLYLIGCVLSGYSFVFLLVHLFYTQIPDIVLGSIATTMSFGFAFMAVSHNDFVMEYENEQ